MQKQTTFFSSSLCLMSVIFGCSLTVVCQYYLQSPLSLSPVILSADLCFLLLFTFVSLCLPFVSLLVLLVLGLLVADVTLFVFATDYCLAFSSQTPLFVFTA